MSYVECEITTGLVRIRLFEKSCPYLKKLQFFSIISFKTVFLLLCYIEFFRLFWFRANVMSYVECELSKSLVRIRLFEKSCPYLKKLQFFSIISFKTVFLVLRNIEFFRFFWFRANVMGYLECELSKGLVRIRLFEKSCPYLKKLQFFSIISFKTVFLVLRNIEFFRFFWFRANVMGYLECELSKGLVRIRLFEKSCPYLKKLQFFSIISFKTVFLVLRNIEFFRFFWFRANVMGYLECELSKGLVRIRLFEKSCPYFKKLQFSL